MTREPSRLLIFAASALLLAGCSQTSDEQAKSKPRAKVPSAELEASEPETSETEAAEIETVLEIEIATPAAAAEHNAVPSTPISPSPTKVTWREVASFDAALEFIYVADGVIARSGGRYYELDADGSDSLSPRAQLKLPEAELFGSWPDDVWYVVSKALSAADGDDDEPRFEHQLLKLDAERQWVPITLRDKDRWAGEEFGFHKGWQGGVFIREGSMISRVGGRRESLKIGPRMGKVVLEVYESHSGHLYTVSSRPTGIYVQNKCSNFACVQENAKKLPYGSEWSFSASVPRQRHGLSIRAKVENEGVSVHHLLHCGSNGWRLESLVHAPTGLWATEGGELWLTVNDRLWYRDGDEAWHDVTLPEGASSISAAMLGDRGELWLAASVGAKHLVFATLATAEPG